MLRTQLQTACGTAAPSASGTTVNFSSTSSTLDFFSDPNCIGKPSSWVIPSGSSDLDVYFMSPTQEMVTLAVSSAGLDSGTQPATIVCRAGEKPCGFQCIVNSACCTNADCTDGGVQWNCGGSGVCAPPTCSGFPNNCSTWDDRSAANADRTITFSSSGYSPRCIQIASGQSVTFSGSFFIHPLQQTCGSSDKQMYYAGPGSTKTISFFGFGTYGYRCQSHPTFENGAIKVQ